MSFALPMFREGLKRCMGHPLGERIIVRPFPPCEETGGIIIPDVAKERPYAGRIVSAGDQACDKLWDIGVDRDDEVWWSKFAGVIQMWQHITKDGKEGCTHEWSHARTAGDRVFVSKCSLCGAEKTEEVMIVLNVDDIMVDVDLEERIEGGRVKRYRGTTDSGKTRYVFERLYVGQEGWRDSWEF